MWRDLGKRVGVGFFDGFEVEFVDVGEVTLRVRHGGDGPPVVLLHGHPTDPCDLAYGRCTARAAVLRCLSRPSRLWAVDDAADPARPFAVVEARDG